MKFNDPILVFLLLRGDNINGPGDTWDNRWIMKVGINSGQANFRCLTDACLHRILGSGFVHVSLRLILTALFAAALFCEGGTLMADDGFDREALKVQDEIKLRSGATLTGTVIKEETVDNRKFVIFENDAGERLTLDVAKLVQTIRLVDEIAQEYNGFIDKIEDTASAHHDMVTWCIQQDKGRSRFKDQIQFHRERIMALDPNDTKVRKQLEYTFIEDQGRWVLEAQYWQSIGYAKDGPRWIPTMQARINDAEKSDDDKSLSPLQRWDRRRRTLSGPQLEAELLSFVDEDVVSRLVDRLSDEKNANLLRVYMEAFGRVPCESSNYGLTYLWMEYAEERAIDLLKQEGFNRYSAVRILTGQLGSSDNAKIQRAAFAIGELGTSNAILALTSALQTRHRIKPGSNPGAIGATFGNNGVNGFGVGNNSKPIDVDVKNEQVLIALEKVTGVEDEFGYNKEAWRQWYVKNYTHYDLPARR